MITTTPMPVSSPSIAQGSAYKIVVVPKAPAGASVLTEFSAPARLVALWEPVVIPHLRKPQATPPPINSMTFVHVPPGADVAPWERWMESGSEVPAPPAIEIVMRSDRILWRPGQALVIGAPDRIIENLIGLVHFTFYEAELRKLESEIDDNWLFFESDVALTHGVDQSSFARWPHVNAMTQWATLARMRFVRLDGCFESSTIDIPGPAKRLISELSNMCDISSRTEFVDNKLEVYEDCYELANDRISEYSHFKKEYNLEVYIIYLLVAEVILMVWEIYFSIRNSGA